MSLASVDLRPMRGDDVGPVVEIFQRSLREMRVAIGLPPGYDSVRLDGGVSHLLHHDPDGSWVAESRSGEIAGFAQASMRGDLWVLGHLFVDPPSQSSGVGRRLLSRAWSYGKSCKAGLIASTPLPAAITLYARMPGFVVHPMISAAGTVNLDALPPAEDVTDDDPRGKEIADSVDHRVRGGAHGPDIDYLLSQGAILLTIPDRGYAVVSPEQVDLLAATDESAGQQLLAEALRRTRPNAVVSIKRIGSGQPWASRMSVEAGLRLSPWGPLVSFNSSAATSHYLPDSAFC